MQFQLYSKYHSQVKNEIFGVRIANPTLMRNQNIGSLKCGIFLKQIRYFIKIRLQKLCAFEGNFPYDMLIYGKKRRHLFKRKSKGDICRIKETLFFDNKQDLMLHDCSIEICSISGSFLFIFQINKAKCKHKIISFFIKYLNKKFANRNQAQPTDFNNRVIIG